ncbi:MAG: DUF86 domain-containing protein [Deltaproteobacteria bacterium]|nr:DUF86 domain-containing protein [Deltaproteobacteria bacterium]
MDKGLMLRKLEELERCVSGLERLRAHDVSAFEKDLEKRWALERGLFVAIQIVLDIGAHMLAELGETGIEDYTEIIERLGDKGVIPKAFSERIKAMAGFRNILVHEYARVDMRRVYDMLQNHIKDLREFAGYITKGAG